MSITHKHRPHTGGSCTGAEKLLPLLRWFHLTHRSDNRTSQKKHRTCMLNKGLMSNRNHLRSPATETDSAMQRANVGKIMEKREKINNIHQHGNPGTWVALKAAYWRTFPNVDMINSAMTRIVSGDCNSHLRARK